MDDDKTEEIAASDSEKPLEVTTPARAWHSEEDGDELDWLDKGHIPPEDLKAADINELPGKLEKLPITSVQPNEWNPNVQSEKEMHALMERIREVGFINPIQVVPLEGAKDRYVILGGEHRYHACKALGYKEIPSVVLTDKRFKSKDLQKFVTMQLNMIRGKIDPEKFIKLYHDLARRYDDASMQTLMGFTEKSKFNLLVKSVAESLPPDAQGEFKKRASGIDNVDELRAIVEELLAKQGDDMRLSFMVFTIGDQPNVWVRMNEDTNKILQTLLGLCRAKNIDLNIALQEALSHAAGYFGVAKSVK